MKNLFEFEFEIVKSNITILDVVNRYATSKIEQKGNKCWILSPFKTEKTASCCLYLKNNSFYDYSTDKAGDVICFVAYLLNLTNYEACLLIQKDFNLSKNKIEITNELEKKILEKKKRENEAKMLLKILDNFERNLCFKLKLFNKLLNKFGRELELNDIFLMHLLLEKNRIEILLDDFFESTLDEKVKIFLNERKRNNDKKI